jgi:hypothetical protein
MDLEFSQTLDGDKKNAAMPAFHHCRDRDASGAGPADGAGEEQ